MKFHRLFISHYDVFRSDGDIHLGPLYESESWLYMKEYLILLWLCDIETLQQVSLLICTSLLLNEIDTQETFIYFKGNNIHQKIFYQRTNHL